MVMLAGIAYLVPGVRDRGDRSGARAIRACFRMLLARWWARAGSIT